MGGGHCPITPSSASPFSLWNEAQGPRTRVGFLGGDSEPPFPPHQLGGLGSAVSSPSWVRGGARKIWILEDFGTSEITSERSASFWIWRQQANMGGTCPCPNVEPPLFVHFNTTRYVRVWQERQAQDASPSPQIKIVINQRQCGSRSAVIYDHLDLAAVQLSTMHNQNTTAENREASRRIINWTWWLHNCNISFYN